MKAGKETKTSKDTIILTLKYRTPLRVMQLFVVEALRIRIIFNTVRSWTKRRQCAKLHQNILNNAPRRSKIRKNAG